MASTGRQSRESSGEGLAAQKKRVILQDSSAGRWHALSFQPIQPPAPRSRSEIKLT